MNSRPRGPTESSIVMPPTWHACTHVHDRCRYCRRAPPALGAPAFSSASASSALRPGIYATARAIPGPSRRADSISSLTRPRIERQATADIGRHARTACHLGRLLHLRLRVRFLHGPAHGYTERHTHMGQHLSVCMPASGWLRLCHHAHVRRHGRRVQSKHWHVFSTAKLSGAAVPPWVWPGSVHRTAAP